MNYCYHCGEEVTPADDEMELIRRGGLDTTSTVRTMYQTLHFHLKCWEEVAGDKYTPAPLVKETMFSYAKDENTGFFKADSGDIQFACSGSLFASIAPQANTMTIEGDVSIKNGNLKIEDGKLDLDSLDVVELKKRLGIMTWVVWIPLGIFLGIAIPFVLKGLSW